MADLPKIPAQPKPEWLCAIIDTREQNPWDMAPFRSIRGTLAAGDYSAVGLESVVTIERKSLPDYLGCCGVERLRFDAEMLRMLGYPVRAVIIEASWADLERGNWRSRITPQSVVASTLGWIASGVPFILASDRETAQRYAVKLLYIAARRRWREARGLLVNAGKPAELVEGAA
jgi:DNA excision repair protein ERCC-4